MSKNKSKQLSGVAHITNVYAQAKKSLLTKLVETLTYYTALTLLIIFAVLIGALMLSGIKILVLFLAN